MDLERYPIFDLSSTKGQQVLRDAQAQLALDGSCILPGFVKAGVVERMTAEVSELETWNRNWPVSAYFGRGDPPPSAGPEHTYYRLWPQNIHAVANDLIPSDALVKRVYRAPAVKSFIARAIRKPVLHEYADEFQSLNIMYTFDGGERSWHYDGSDTVITLMLQPPEAGGRFEFAPFIRGDGRIDELQGCETEPWERVQALFEADASLKRGGAHPGVKGLRATAGDLVIFNGQRSLHRVSAVRGQRKRDRRCAQLRHGARSAAGGGLQP